MQRDIISLTGYNMEATDGHIGKVEEFYFEDNTWLIRYLILKTGNWFVYRKVLIAPQAIVKREARLRIFPVNLSKEQIRASSDIDSDKPVSRQQDIALYGHYAFQRYDSSGFYAGGSAAAMDNVPIIEEKIMTEGDANIKRSDDDHHLRSTKTIMGYHVHASDGDFAHVSDFIFDDTNWQIMYLVVDSHNWFGGKKYLIETGTVKEIQWDHSKVIVSISTDAIKDSPVFDESQFKYSRSGGALLVNS